MTTNASISIKGMTCGGCVKSVENKVRKLEGVESISVDLKAGRATVAFESDRVSAAKIAAAIVDAGFEATVN